MAKKQEDAARQAAQQRAIAELNREFEAKGVRAQRTQTAQASLLEPFVGECVGLSDGDTINVMRKGRVVRIRLHGVDCPKKLL